MKFFEINQKLTEKALARSDLIAKPNADEKQVKKRLDRFALFANKFAKRLPFKTTGDEEVKLKVTSDAKNDISNGELPTIFDVAARRKVGTEEWRVPTTHTEAVIKLTQLEKTADLGGEESGKRLDKETKALESLQQQITDLKGAKPYIHIDIGGTVVKAAGVVNVEGGPKSDFNLVDKNNKPVAFISHKDGSPASPKKFGQWAGVSAFANHPEVKSFGRKFLKQYPNGMPSGATALSYPIKDFDLQMRAVYGKDFGGDFGINNVNCVIQGPPRLEKMSRGNKYKLSGLLLLTNGEELPEGYQPIFIARYFGGRNDLGIPNTRIVMYPKFGRKSIDLSAPKKKAAAIVPVANAQPTMTAKEKAKAALASGGNSKKG